MFPRTFSSFFVSIVLVFGLTQPISSAAITGTISTLGLPGYSRTFSYPADIAKLSDGSLLVLDQARYEIYRFDGNTASSFATFARRFNSYITGDEPCALDVSKSNEIYVVNCSQTKLYKFDSRGVLQKTFDIPLLVVKKRGFDWGGRIAVDSKGFV